MIVLAWCYNAVESFPLSYISSTEGAVVLKNTICGRQKFCVTAHLVQLDMSHHDMLKSILWHRYCLLSICQPIDQFKELLIFKHQSGWQFCLLLSINLSPLVSWCSVTSLPHMMISHSWEVVVQFLVCLMQRLVVRGERVWLYSNIVIA